MVIRSDRRKVQFALCLAVFLVPFMGSSLNLAMPRIANDFSMSAFFQTFLVSSYLVGAAMFQMPAARLGDLFGRRRIFLIGLAAFGLFSILSGFAWSGNALLFCRFACGVGSAMVFATNMAILSAVFPKEERGQAFGINTAVVYFAVAIGPLLGGLLSQHLGWRSIFFACFLLTAAAFVFAARSIRDEWTEAAGESFDHRGAGVYAVAVAGVVAGFSFLPHWGGWTMLGLGTAAFILFVKLEARTAVPMLKLDLFFNNRHFRLGALSAMINYAASLGSRAR